METIARVRPGSHDSGGTLARGVEHANTAAQGSLDAASDAVRPAVDRVALGAHRAVDTLAGAAGDAARALGVKGEQLRSAQVRAVEQCRGYVAANPLTALGIAAAAGFLLSRVLSSR